MVYYSEQVDQVFAAVASPTRREILDRLRQGEQPISTLAQHFDMTLPAVSKHVHVLESAGLLHIRREGRTRVCHLDPSPLRVGERWLERFRGIWEDELTQIARYLGE